MTDLHGLFENLPIDGSANGHNPWKLTEMFLTTSNDRFFEIYGFNWVPPLWMQDKIRERLEKELAEKIRQSFVSVNLGCNKRRSCR